VRHQDFRREYAQIGVARSPSQIVGNPLGVRIDYESLSGLKSDPYHVGDRLAYDGECEAAP
jgi:hypothetical protein